MAKVLMTNNLGSAVEAGMLADLSHLRDHSLPWFLSDHPDACCLIFLSREFIFSPRLYYEVSVFTDHQLFFF